MINSNDSVKAQRGRSRAYPAIALGEALEKVRSINANLGLNGQYNRESIAAGMGYSSLNGTSARRIAALVQYGLLDREKDLYFLSTSAKKYLLPVADNDQESVTKLAAIAPVLFADIYERLKGQVLPRQFTNRLVQEFGIEQKAASDVEKVFKSTMETAGFLQSNGVLSASIDDTVANTEGVEDLHSQHNDKNQAPADTKHVSPTGYLSVELPSGLMISYSTDLASAFAFGNFGVQLKSLDDAVSGYISSTMYKSNEEV